MGSADEPIENRNRRVSNPARGDCRRLVRAELLGKHSHRAGGIQVHLFTRQGKYIARGRLDGGEFGVTLGETEQTAEIALRRCLTDLDDGRFVRRSEAPRRSRRVVANHTLRSLAELFLARKDAERGTTTADAYRTRLQPVIAFSETPAILKRYPRAKDLDVTFVDQLKQHLASHQITRNGKANGVRKLRSPHDVRLILETLRTCINWARRPHILALPAEFPGIVLPEHLPKLPMKDPLRKVGLPLPVRIELIRRCSADTFPWLAQLVVLPLRFEDIANAAIGDIDNTSQTWRIGAGFGGQLHNKAGTPVTLPMPVILLQLIQIATGQRGGGPVFLGRPGFQASPRIAGSPFRSPQDFADHVNHRLLSAPAEDVENSQKRKLVIQRALKAAGGITPPQIGKRLKSLYSAVGVPAGVRPYDLRAAVTTEMHQAGVPHLELRYLTLHHLTDILHEYTTLDTTTACLKYFEAVAPLLNAIAERARSLGFLAVNTATPPTTAMVVRDWCASGAHLV